MRCSSARIRIEHSSVFAILNFQPVFRSIFFSFVVQALNVISADRRSHLRAHIYTFPTDKPTELSMYGTGIPNVNENDYNSILVPFPSAFFSSLSWSH